MKLSLDTNAYSAFKNGNLELMRMLEDADELFVSATVLGELYSDFQIGRLTEKNSTELNTFLSKPGISITAVTNEIAFRYGYLIKTLRKQGTPIPTNDIWIAASTMETGSILLTGDKHFNHVPGLMVLDY